ncbi:hypothetical protein MYCTH_2308630 [Thermothelomyces thermophilus ATCC 42464]|uniref:DZF domain-containing protein n=1 Tax=Thermothelomyces thermophilus (strain ATCC 42464 / BCRC 31852 / DSM 1799) TaxID=573729 RepID=G2QK26_THET4|nr:uncharacterized protein MYCTH_2308630 [Thermothelomyces thermophilus ATCC 42464]AEO59932.1 hypothetical protein MYCTH_2308630 [Thermothelomyces thermophilus ATCC 42464]
MAQQQSLSSNNPFRRKAASSAPAAPPAAVPRFADLDESPGPTPGVEPDLPPADLFRHQLQSLSASTEPPPETSFRKPKVVKKVRVQSPPSSPDSSGVPEQFPSASSDEDDSSIGPSDETGNHEDPFDRASSTDSADVSDKGEDDPQPLPTYRTPPNPFEKTLRDLNVGPAGSEKKGPERASGTRGVLDVDAFGRLLLTGQAGGAASSQAASPFITEHDTKHPPAPNSNGATTRDATSAPRSPSSGTLQVAQDTPQLSREALEHAGQSDGSGSVSSVQPSTLPNVQTTPPHPKKKPPPPSSRHGKLINPGPAGAAAESKPTAGGAQGPVTSPGRRATTSLTPASPSSPHSANRSLSSASQEPPAEEASNSVPDREAAGKLLGPEIQPGLNIVIPPRPPTPPNASHATVVTGTQSSRKPAPPPRRQPHVRSGSKTASGAVSAVQHDDPELPVRRSSVDSTKSRSSAAARVGVHAPAPPPPRRPSHASRGSISHAVPPPSPTAPSEDSEPIFLSGGAPIVSSPATVSDDTPDGSGSSTPAPAQPPATAAPGTKPVPPPPPPARNASVRGKRPAASRTVPASPSSSSPDASGLTRRSSGSGNRGKEPPPPPTRHRDRGNSRGSSVEGAAAASGWAESQQPVPDAERSVDSGPAGMESHAGEILADLNALQREVDALRGQVEKAG